MKSRRWRGGTKFRPEKMHKKLKRGLEKKYVITENEPDKHPPPTQVGKDMSVTVKHAFKNTTGSLLPCYRDDILSFIYLL